MRFKELQGVLHSGFRKKSFFFQVTICILLRRPALMSCFPQVDISPLLGYAKCLWPSPHFEDFCHMLTAFSDLQGYAKQLHLGLLLGHAKRFSIFGIHRLCKD